MIDITKVLNDILKAVLGKDVRQAIHDGIKRSNEIANDCDKRQSDLENQYEQLVKNFSSSSPSDVEIVDARTGPDGTVYGTDVHKGAEYGNQSKTHSGLIFVQQL